MTMDKSIFGLRFGANVSLQPTHEELQAFLGSKKQEGGPELHGSVLAPYNKVLESVLWFRRGHLPDADAPALDEREKMFYGVLSHSFFFNLGLKSAVEQYKYQLHELSTIDVRKHRSFINAAEQEIGQLSSWKKADAARKAKMQDMVNERKKLLETLTSRRPALVEELRHLALYIRDNLLKIANRCETSIAVLVESAIARKKENQLIADTTMEFEDQPDYGQNDGLAAGGRRQDAENDLALLSKEIANTFRENTFALTQLYEAIYEHTLKTAREIDALMGEYRRTGNRSFAEEAEFFTRIEKVLDSLMSGTRFELNATESESKTTYQDVFLKKRREMFDYLFELMQKDRRSWMRRSGEPRRSSDDTQYQAPSRRSGRDRRAGKDRRRVLSLSA